MAKKHFAKLDKFCGKTKTKIFLCPGKVQKYEEKITKKI